jgi:hypothetical protein
MPPTDRQRLYAAARAHDMGEVEIALDHGQRLTPHPSGDILFLRTDGVA